MDIPISLALSYATFSFLLFYQQLHLKNYQGESAIFGIILGAFALISMLFGFGFLIYWGYKISWIEAVTLFGIAFAVQIAWFPIEAKLGMRDSYSFFSLAGFIVMPVCAYFMWAALP